MEDKGEELFIHTDTQNRMVGSADTVMFTSKQQAIEPMALFPGHNQGYINTSLSVPRLGLHHLEYFSDKTSVGGLETGLSFY